MYIWGGEGIHGFAFCLLIGIVVGTFSSIFIASPILLWLAQREQAARAASKVTS
jgi:SecD/SecF fusion protein